MLTISLKTVWAHRRRLIGTLVAVALGVAFLSGTLLLGDTLRANFDTLFQQANSGTDVVVRSAVQISDNVGQSNHARVDASLVPIVQRVAGVDTAIPYIEGFGQLLGRDGKALGGNGPPTRAANWVTVPSLNPYHIVEGRAPQADDEAVINRGAAKSGDLHVGDTTTLLTPQPMQIRIVGITTFGTADGFGPTTYTGLTLEAAKQHLTDDPSHLTEIRVKADAGVSPDQLASRVSSALPSNVEAITGTQLASENFTNVNSSFLGIVRNGLVMFAVVALLVATFSIFNTFSILVAQRGRQSALLRALGATRRQVVSTSAAETAIVGLVGSALGWVAGVGLAALLKGVFDAFGFALPAGGLVFTPTSAAVAVAAGFAATAVAGMIPAVRASRVPPIAALRDLAVEAPVVTVRRSIVGGALTATGVIAMIVAASGHSLVLAALGAIGCLGGGVIVGPVLARPVVTTLGTPVAAVRGITGRLARQNAVRHPRRTSATAAALFIGVSVVALFTVFGASLKASASKAIDDSLRADYIVDTTGYGGQSGGAGFSPQVAEAVRTIPQVQSATEMRAGNAVIDERSRKVTIVDPATVSDVIDLGVQTGTLTALDDDGLAVSHDEAVARHWQPGSMVAITYPDGTTGQVSIVAVYGRSDLVGDYLLSSRVWTPHDAQTLDRQVLVKLSPSAVAPAVRGALEAASKSFGDVRVQTSTEFRASITGGVNTILGLIYVMLGLAIVIALMGIANTLSLAIHERSRELGLLRAVGQTRRQARSMVRWEAVMIAVFGTVVGVALGTFLGWGVVEAAASGTLTRFAAPPAQLIVFLIVGAISGTVAAIRPARRAARLDILAAIETD